MSGITFDTGRAFEPYAEPPPDTPAEGPAMSWRSRSLLELGSKAIAPPTIGQLLYPGLRHVISGESEALKTWLTACFAAAEMLDGQAVVLIDLEQPPAMTLERIRQLGVPDDVIAEQLEYLRPEAGLGDRERELVAEMLDVCRPTLVIIDGFTSLLTLHGLDGSKGLDVDWVFTNVLAFLCQHDAAVVVLDHVTKNRETRGRYSIGSERKLTACDVHIGLERVQPFGRGEHGVSKIVVHKDRGGHHKHGVYGLLHLRSDSETGAVAWNIDQTTAGLADAPRAAFRPTALMERVSQYLERSYEPASRRAVEQGVTGKAAGLRTAIDVLIREGNVKATPGGAGGAVLLELVTRYRQADDPESDIANSASRSASPVRPSASPESVETPRVPPDVVRGRGRTRNDRDSASLDDELELL